jgi:NTP pyrophosphatase (non-canonical NTP hydrolase)
MEQLIKQIEQWASDRNIIKGSKPIDQAMKLFSEFGELADSIAKSNLDGIIDGVGDVFVVLTIMAKQLNLGFSKVEFKVADVEYEPKDIIVTLGYALSQFSAEQDKECFADCITALLSFCLKTGLDLEGCVQIAYNDIKDRKGILWNGVFVKSTDKNYNDVLKIYQDSMEGNYSA